MSRALIVLDSPPSRDRAAHWLSIAPFGTRLEFKKPTRSLPQNDKMWAMLTEIAAQKEWHGQKLTPDDWKHVFTAALRRELRMVPNLDGNAMVLLGQSTSDMTKEEMSDLIELMLAYGAEWGVVFSDPQEPANDATPELDLKAAFLAKLATLTAAAEITAAGNAVKTDAWFISLKEQDRGEAKALLDAVSARLGEIEAG